MMPTSDRAGACPREDQAGCARLPAQPRSLIPRLSARKVGLAPSGWNLEAHEAKPRLGGFLKMPLRGGGQSRATIDRVWTGHPP